MGLTRDASITNLLTRYRHFPQPAITKMDEQVVPTFAPAPPPTLRRSATTPSALSSLVPSAPRAAEAPPALSPAPEFRGKPRWETPLRARRQREPWQGARELGIDVCVRTAAASAVGSVVRATVADVVVAYVGPTLPRPTVEKWLCLLCEYLELNADEQVLVVCLLRRYVQSGGRFVGRGDWARPQRWECVVAVACYMAVLLTEEFPGRTAMDLRELLGPNFRFGSEQISFLKVVDWRISVDNASFKEVRETCEAMLGGDVSARNTMNEWFQVDQAVMDRKRRAGEEAAVAAAAAVQQPVGKKRAYAAIAPADDSVVPRVVLPRIEAHHPIPAAYVPTVPHWAAHAW